MLNKFRQIFEPLINKFAIYVTKTNLPPLFWSCMGLLTAFFSGLIYSGIFYNSTFIAGIFLIISGLADILDGSVARITNSISKRGAFIDSTFDRLSEFFIFFGILIGGLCDPMIILLALSFSFLVSYSRSRGETLGLNVSGIGIGERAERMLILIFASLLGYVYYGIVLVLIVSLVTFIQRFFIIIKNL